MFQEDQAKYLIRQLSNNKVVLFLGAGFSVGATNAAGKAIPLSGQLAESLWPLLQVSEPYAGEPLGEVYQAILSSGVPHATIRNTLESLLLCRTVPDEYNAIAYPFWHRAYTTNVDDLLPIVYRRSGAPKLEVLAYPHDDVTERDQSLACLQLVYLNGRLPCRPDEITFSPRQYGRAASRRQPLYEQFVRDYAIKPVVFVGTRLDEPIFWQALAERGDQAAGGENRPKSFLITPAVSPSKRLQLRELNVEPVLMETAEFLAWLQAVAPQLPSRMQVVQQAAPDLAAVLQSAPSGMATQRDLARFGTAFSPVPVEVRQTLSRSLYLLGAAPRWDDLIRDLDAPREITSEIVAAINNALDGSVVPHVLAVLGTAGSGKSTIIRRAGLRLAREGRLVFVTNSETLPAPEVIRNTLNAYDQPTVLLFDNAEVALSQLPDLISRCVGLPKPPIFVIASRTNDFDRLWRRIDANVEFHEFEVPHLNRAEIVAVIDVLERNGLLGKLQGLSRDARIRVFEEKARKQILVAMREATTSLGFDLIIRDEFEKLVPLEAQALYLCVALATDAGYRLTKDEFIGCAEVEPAQALAFLDRNLRDVVVPFGAEASLLMLRHRLIAEMVLSSASRSLLKDAYVRLLTCLAIHATKNWRSRASGLTKALLSHRVIYERFRFEIDEARAIFGSLTTVLGGDAHFWLQFGNLELEGAGGDLAFAENYLKQAEALNPTNEYIQNAVGHLLIKKGVYASDIESATQLKKAGSDVLQANMDRSKYSDAYAVHIFCRQRYDWMKRWLLGDAAQKGELEFLRRVLAEAITVNPRHRRLARLKDVLDRAYLQLAIPRAQRPPAPRIDER